MPPRDVEISYFVGRDGSGELIANPTPDGGWGFVSWEECPLGGAPCRPMPSSERVLRGIANVPAGTTFAATARGSGLAITRRSDPWQGPLRVVTPPRVSGPLRVGELVQPVPGAWAGGWGGERPDLQLQACRTRAAARCEVISATFYWDSCPGTGAVLSSAYRGWYVRVADTRWARRPDYAGFAVFRPQALNPQASGPTSATATVGPVGAATRPLRLHCGAVGPRPPRLVARIGRRGRQTLAQISCAEICSATATVRQGRVRLTVRRRYRSDGALSLSAGQARRLRRGRAVLTVRVGPAAPVARRVAVA